MLGDQSVQSDDLLVANFPTQPCLEELLDERVVPPSAHAGVAAPAQQAKMFGLGDLPARLDIVNLAHDRGQFRKHGLEECGSHQEPLGSRLEIADDLFSEIVVQVAGGAGQPFDEVPDFDT